MSPRWRPTNALVGAIAIGGPLMVLAVIFRHADLLLLAVPLVLGTLVGLTRRPLGAVRGDVEVSASSMLEDERTLAHVWVQGIDALDVVSVQLQVGRYQVYRYGRPHRATGLTPGERRELEFDLRSVRWGRHTVGPARIHVTAAHGLLQCGPLQTGTASITTLPLQQVFDAVDAVPRAEGIVGPHRSRRPGDGTDIAGVREFVVGDRLHRINWPVSLRLGGLHVTSTLSDRDTNVFLVLDTHFDLGRSEGIDGASSSLDLTVRSAASIAEYYLRHGDRVGLIDMGQAIRQVRPGSGRAHLIRLLDVLLDAAPSTTSGISTTMALGQVSSGSLVVMLSPLVGENAINRTATLARAGHSVVVIDTLPEDAAPPRRSEWTALAWRLWLLERAGEIGRLSELGVPVVRWRGAGSLDEVLHDVSRAASAPRALR
ncbi:MAG TPA: DUF58 domain-containing protein [Mycobacteriales bacterium]|nr:DUF58 domain-containing protein [Mycobacteriales bacterium]